MPDLFEAYSSPDGYPPNCCIGIELTRRVSDYDVDARTQAYRMRVEVSRAQNVDPNVFVYQVVQPSETNPSAYSQFSRVASPLDLEELPYGIPGEPQLATHFRLAELDLLFSHRQTLEEAWAAIVADRDELVRTLQQLCEVQVDQVSAAGCFEEEEGSSEPSEEPSEEPSDEPSAEPPDCGELPGCLVLTFSDHPALPVGLKLFPQAPDPAAPCEAEWLAEGPDGVNLYVQTDQLTGQAAFSVSSLDETDEGTVQLSLEYGAVLQYLFGGIPRAVWVEASDDC